jgi:hypothetical protein
VINDEPYLVSKDVRVSKSSTGEKNTVVSYEYDDSYVGEMCLAWVFGCTYDSKGRLIYKATGESGHGFVYNDDHQIVYSCYLLCNHICCSNSSNHLGIVQTDCWSLFNPPSTNE